jgi:hypothetical protein
MCIYKIVENQINKWAYEYNALGYMLDHTGFPTKEEDEIINRKRILDKRMKKAAKFLENFFPPLAEIFQRKKITNPATPTQCTTNNIISFLTNEVCNKTGWSASSTAESFDENAHKVFLLTLGANNIINVVYDCRYPTIISFVRDSGAYEILESMIPEHFGEGAVRLLPI